MYKPSYVLSQESYNQMHWWKDEKGYYVSYKFYSWFWETLDKAKRDIRKEMKEHYEHMISLPTVSKKGLKKKFNF